MNNIFEKNSLTLILLKIFDIYLCHYFATNKKIAITHLWHAIEHQTICHLIAMQCATGLKLYYVIAYQTLDE